MSSSTASSTTYVPTTGSIQGHDFRRLPGNLETLFSPLTPTNVGAAFASLRSLASGIPRWPNIDSQRSWSSVIDRLEARYKQVGDRVFQIEEFSRIVPGLRPAQRAARPTPTDDVLWLTDVDGTVHDTDAAFAIIAQRIRAWWSGKRTKEDMFQITHDDIRDSLPNTMHHEVPSALTVLVLNRQGAMDWPEGGIAEGLRADGRKVSFWPGVELSWALMAYYVHLKSMGKSDFGVVLNSCGIKQVLEGTSEKFNKLYPGVIRDIWANDIEQQYLDDEAGPKDRKVTAITGPYPRLAGVIHNPWEKGNRVRRELGATRTAQQWRERDWKHSPQTRVHLIGVGDTSSDGSFLGAVKGMNHIVKSRLTVLIGSPALEKSLKALQAIGVSREAVLDRYRAHARLDIPRGGDIDVIKSPDYRVGAENGPVETLFSHVAGLELGKGQNIDVSAPRTQELALVGGAI